MTTINTSFYEEIRKNIMWIPPLNWTYDIYCFLLIFFLLFVFLFCFVFAVFFFFFFVFFSVLYEMPKPIFWEKKE